MCGLFFCGHLLFSVHHCIMFWLIRLKIILLVSLLLGLSKHLISCLFKFSLLYQLEIFFNQKIVGYTDLPSRLPTQSSTLYANNLKNYLFSMGEKGKGEFVIDLKDEVVRGSIVLQDGKMMWPPPALDVPVPSPPKPKAVVKPPEQSPFSAAAWETGLTTGMSQDCHGATCTVR